MEGGLGSEPHNKGMGWGAHLQSQETGGAAGQGYLWLHEEFLAILDYMRPGLKIK